MCLEDIKIMAKSNAFMATANISLTAAEILSQSPTRIGVIFNPHNTDSYWVSTDPNVAIGQGIPVLVGQAPVRLDVFHYGDFCRRNWFGISVAGAIVVAIGELHLQHDLARLANYGKVED